MRRLLLLSLIILLFLSCVGLTFFTFSPLRVSGQPYLRSLDDFLFMLNTDGQRFTSQPVPPFNRQDCHALIERVGPKTHRWVKDAILWRLQRWGDDAAPALIDELYFAPLRQQAVIAAQALSEMQHVEGIKAAAQVLAEIDQDPRDVPMFREHLLRAIGQSGVSEAAEILVDYYRPDLLERIAVLEALGRLGAAEVPHQ